MKRTFILALLLVSAVFADTYCRLHVPIEIHFLDSTIWYDQHTFRGCYTIVGDSVYDTLADGYKCPKEESEKAFLDSNVFFYRGHIFGEHKKPGEQILYVFQVNTSTYNIGDVIKDEFMHWQECGMLSLTHEEADSLSTFLADSLNNFYNELNSLETDMFAYYPYSYDNPDQIIEWTKKACQSAVPIQPRKFAYSEIVFKNHQAYIPPYLRGKKYFVFDLNGKTVQQGIAEETVRIQQTPVILKIGSQNPILLK